MVSDVYSKYKYISSKEQRYAYKADFNTQYDEYRRLHSSIEKVANFFEQLRQQLKQHEEGSDDYEVGQGHPSSEYIALGKLVVLLEFFPAENDWIKVDFRSFAKLKKIQKKNRKKEAN